jgi:hypothetical protein
MLKRLFTILFLFAGLSVSASDNFLNSIVISKADGNTSVILRSDEVAKIKREVESNDEIVLTLKNMKQSSGLDTLYKNISDVNGMIIQNSGSDLKIFIDAPDISKANIVFETPDSAPIVASDNKSESKFVWSIISIALLLLVMRSAKNISVDKPQKDINEIIKEREKELYKNFQKEVATLPSINYKLKGYRKHVLKGETIRSYENRVAKYIN